MAHTHTLLWSFFVVCWKYLCSFFFWKVSHFRMMIFCSLRSFTYLLVARQMLALSSLRLQHAVPEEEGDEDVDELPRLVFLRNNPPPLVLFINLTIANVKVSAQTAEHRRRRRCAL